MPQLAQLVREKYPGTYDDLSDAELEAAVRDKFPGVYDDLVEPKVPEHPHARFGRLIKENLPVVGGAIGGALGTPAGPAGMAMTAGLGGMAGRALQRVIEGEGGSPASVAADVATSGATEAATQAAGGVAAKGLTAGGARLYRGLLKPSKALRDQHPNLVKTLIKIRAPISDKGAGITDRALTASHDKATEILQKAAPGAAPITSSEIIPEFSGTLGKLRDRRAIGQPSELSTVFDRGVRLVKQEPPQGFDLMRAQELKRTAQDAAHAGYRQAERGTVKEVSADTMLDADVARGFRKAIEGRAPSVAPVNRETQALMGGKSALDDAIERERNNLAIGGAKDFLGAGLGVAGYSAGADPETAATLGLLARLLATPAVGSRAAIQAVRAGQIAPSAIPQLLRLLSVSHDE